MDSMRLTVAAVMKDIETRKAGAEVNDPGRYLSSIFGKKSFAISGPHIFETAYAP